MADGLAADAGPPPSARRRARRTRRGQWPLPRLAHADQPALGRVVLLVGHVELGDRVPDPAQQRADHLGGPLGPRIDVVGHLAHGYRIGRALVGHRSPVVRRGCLLGLSRRRDRSRRVVGTAPGRRRLPPLGVAQLVADLVAVLPQPRGVRHHVAVPAIEADRPVHAAPAATGQGHPGPRRRRLRVDGHLSRALHRPPPHVVAGEHLGPVVQRSGGERLVERGDEHAPVAANRSGVGEPLVGQQVGPADRRQHCRQVAVGLDADEHEPAAIPGPVGVEQRGGAVGPVGYRPGRAAVGRRRRAHRRWPTSRCAAATPPRTDLDPSRDARAGRRGPRRRLRWP